MQIPVGVSARHVHLSQEHLTALFGAGARLHPKKPLSQPGQFASEEKVDVRGPRGTIQNVRVLGPVRPETQLEISKTDALKLGLQPPVRESGRLEQTPGITVIGPQGQVTLTQGVIVAKRHVHFSPEDARRYGVRDGQSLTLRTTGERGLIFENVTARVSPKYKLDFHLDTDEANAAGLQSGDEAEMIELEGLKAQPMPHFHGNEIIRDDSSPQHEKTTESVG
ncbi:propanediol utilization protein [Tumebacillus flagellatus]|uniref:Phosphate propanoyltransferase n=1 Tax=Tumebacillus flagellatus TaxID=1157490 RepID=A0A074MEJ2_9BACL|nr:propanediol utilization protein [Tumebacillus flagellatus]